MRVVKDCCDAEGISCSGVKSWVTTHGLSGTLETILFEAGHEESSVALRTGNQDLKSLKSYQNLRGCLGKRQQRDLIDIDTGTKISFRTGGMDSEEGTSDMVNTNVAVNSDQVIPCNPSSALFSHITDLLVIQ